MRQQFWLPSLVWRDTREDWLGLCLTMRSSVKISYQVFSPSTEGNVSEDQPGLSHNQNHQWQCQAAVVTFVIIINQHTKSTFGKG